MDNDLYGYSPITERPPFPLPDGKTLAFYVGLNIEHFHIDRPTRSQIPPDPQGHGPRDYGTRVGIWRLCELFGELGIRASAITNSEVCSRYPQIVEAGVAQNWAWIAHGQTNSIRQQGMSREAEVEFLAQMIAELDGALPARPKGWLGPGLSETFYTPELLRDLGFTYLLDWCCDDQPFALNLPGMISVPYTQEVNDVSMTQRGLLTGSEYERMVLDHFEVLLADSANISRVMPLPIHTFVVGQPHLFKAFSRVVREICATPEVWNTTSDDIADHYLSQLATGL